MLWITARNESFQFSSSVCNQTERCFKTASILKCKFFFFFYLICRDFFLFLKEILGLSSCTFLFHNLATRNIEKKHVLIMICRLVLMTCPVFVFFFSYHLRTRCNGREQEGTFFFFSLNHEIILCPTTLFSQVWRRKSLAALSPFPWRVFRWTTLLSPEG